MHTKPIQAREPSQRKNKIIHSTGRDGIQLNEEKKKWEEKKPSLKLHYTEALQVIKVKERHRALNTSGQDQTSLGRARHQGM